MGDEWRFASMEADQLTSIRSYEKAQQVNEKIKLEKETENV